MADEKRRPDRDLPFLNWRYILFKWNDSDDEMARARALAAECWRRSLVLGADRSSRGRVFTPLHPGSRRSSTPSATRSGTTTTSATPSRERRRAARIDVRTSCRASRWSRAPGVRCRCARACTTSRRGPFPAQASYGRRLVRLGAQLCGADGEVLNRRFRARMAAGDARAGRHAWTIPIEIPAPATQPGRYALKFDLVSEGIDWFERCRGSLYDDEVARGDLEARWAR